MTTDALPSFLALHLPEGSSEEAFCALTPHVMQWSNDIWLMDLSVTRNYWELRAARQGSEPLEWLRAILQQLVPGEAKTAPFYAAAAAHPWQAVLLLSYMRERHLKGLISLESLLGRALFQQISWSAWLDSAQRSGDHFLAVKTRRFQEEPHQRNLRLLRAAVARLKLERPWQLHTLPDPAIRRRFGATLALLWDWTYSKTYHKATAPTLLDGPSGAFPWRPWHPPLKPQLERALDFPIWQWEVLVPLLVEDLDRLCQLPSWQPEERVALLTWSLTLHDLSRVEVPIAFRHPHHLHRERGHHKTALLQANYAFAAAMTRATERLPRDELDIATPLVAWSLRIDERLTVPPLLRDLFGGCDEVSQSEASQLLELENQLPVALACYDLRSDWLPEDAFTTQVPASQPWAMSASAKPWLMAAKHRPLFFYAQPQPLQHDGFSSGRVFLERIATKWWLRKDSSGSTTCRDYYRLIDHLKRVQWVYQDSSGKWFVHGLFA